jgi:hypothetical protein
MFTETILHSPDVDHYNTTDYAIVKINNISYGIYDLNLAEGVLYDFKYENRILKIINKSGDYVSEIEIGDVDTITLFENVNSKLENFIIINKEGEAINITIENTIKRYLPGVIKSPIVVLDNKTGEPLDLSASYRWFYKNDVKHYFFTNTEREYFKPNCKLKVASPILDKLNTVTVYGIKHKSRFDLDELLHIDSEALDSIDNCADMYDILFESDFHSINKSTGEIRLENVDDYKYIVVDYIKDESYCINYRYSMNSYEIDIAISDDKDISMYYDNIIKYISDNSVQEYINNKNYYNTGLSPNVSCYIAIGGDKIS